MNHQHTALETVRQIKASRGFQQLQPAEQATLSADLDRISSALADDPWDVALDTPLDLQRRLEAQRSGAARDRGAAQKGAEHPAQGSDQRPPARPQATAEIGARVADTLEAVDFPGFVAGLVTGTFQAIVDATVQQVREYAQLVSSISRSVDDFTRDNVTPGQARQWLAERHPQDLDLVMPKPGSDRGVRLRPRKGRAGTTPGWLGDYGLADESLSDELAEGALVARGQLMLGQERMQSLATMVLMGVNRIVVNEGHIRSKLQFHAAARDRRQVELQQLTAGQVTGVAGRQVSMSQAAQTQVSTLKANAQADASIKADLMGEIHIVFSTESFPLADFADTPAIQLIQRHARWQGESPSSSAAAEPSPGTATPATSSAGEAE
ncbi:hypothetical protein [Haliangium sp.]|uniref:hypothetical protein n=1 Tax=Haliangium sp. TaxID=2663208 RepID=UPI003D10EC5D